MSEVCVSIDIDAAPEEVWDLIMDPNRFDQWVTIHRRLGDVSDIPLKDGSTMDQTLCLRGVNFKVHWRVVELDPPHRVVFEGRGPARSRAVIREELAAVDGGTRFSYTNEFHPPGWPLGTVASRVVIGGVPRREANASLERLKRLIER